MEKAARFRFSPGGVEALKWLAIVLMVIDHVCAILYDREIMHMTAIGRLAFPIFGLLLIHNHLHFTRSPWKQVGRLLLLGAISQPIYFIAFRNGYLNIFFTLAAGLAILTLWDRRRSGLLGAMDALVYGAVILLFSVRVEYGVFGIGYLLAMRAWIRSGKVAWAALAAVMVGLANLSPLALFALPVFPLAYAIQRMGEIPLKRMPKLFFYVFYPAHILLLVLIAGALR